MGGMYYMVTCGVIAGLVFATVLVDIVLATGTGESITTWLRQHPAWYWIPTALMVSLLLALGIHLFGIQERPGP